MEKKLSDKGQLQLLENNNSSDFAVKTCAQINKDLQGISSSIVVLNQHGAQSVLDLLIEQIKPILEDLSERNKLAQFIYLVDLNELEFNLHEFNQNYEELSFLVIKREAQKVYLRMKFGQNRGIE